MNDAEAQAATDMTTLGQARPGQRARITRIVAGRQLTRRLLSLGLRIGTELDVIQRRGRGVVIGRAGTRIALGGGVADKVMVTPVPRDHEGC